MFTDSSHSSQEWRRRKIKGGFDMTWRKDRKVKQLTGKVKGSPGVQMRDPSREKSRNSLRSTWKAWPMGLDQIH